MGQRRVDTLHQQIAEMQVRERERAALQAKLERLQKIEAEKFDLQEKVLERASRSSSRNHSPSMLQAELERLYGKESPLTDRNKTPSNDRSLIETIIQQRTKEFSAKQQAAAMNAKYLDKERLKLQEARRRVEEQRRYLASTSPAGKIPFSFHNDKLYMPYVPYHEFTDRQHRIQESFVLPVGSEEFQRPKKVSFRVKFVPTEFGDNTWSRYNNALIEGSAQEDVDDAMQTFLNFTARHNKARQNKTKVKYVAQPYPDGRQDVSLSYARNTFSEPTKERSHMSINNNNTKKQKYPKNVKQTYPKSKKKLKEDLGINEDGYGTDRTDYKNNSDFHIKKQGNVYSVRHRINYGPVLQYRDEHTE